MIRLVKTFETDFVFPKCQSLYEEAFPKNERWAASPIKEDFGSTCYAAYKEGVFIGFISLLCEREVCHLVYFAILPELRGKGLGGEVLEGLKVLVAPMKIMLDVEVPHKGNKDADKRRRRIDFYKRHGFTLTRTTYMWQGEEYAMMTYGGNISKARWEEFWDMIQGRIKPRK